MPVYFYVLFDLIWGSARRIKNWLLSFLYPQMHKAYEASSIIIGPPFLSKWDIIFYLNYLKFSILSNTLFGAFANGGTSLIAHN